MARRYKYGLLFSETEMLAALWHRKYGVASRIRKAAGIKALNLEPEGFCTLAIDMSYKGNYPAVYVLAAMGMDFSYLTKQTGCEVWRFFTDHPGFYRLIRKLVETKVIQKADYEMVFHNAAASGDIRLMRLMLDLEVDINSTFSGGWQCYTPLIRAVVENQLRSVKFLLENEADVEAKDGEDKTVMQYQMTAQIQKEFYKHQIGQKIKRG